MKAIFTTLIAALGITSLIFAGVTTSKAQQGGAIPKSDRTVWEYKVVIPNETGPDQHERRRNNLEAQLNAAGQDGWEAVEAPYLKGSRYQVVILKRSKLQ